MDNKSDSCEEVIKQVKSQFNSEREHDRKIIRQAMDEYQDSPNSREIIHELSRMLTNYLTQEEIDGFNRALEKSMPEIPLLDSVEEDLNNQRFEEAYKKLDKYMNENRNYIPDEKVEYHVFGNDFEEKIFEKYFTVKRESRGIPFNVPIFMLYHYYAYFLVEQNRMDEAEKYLKIGLEYNPVSPQLLFELIDIYKKKGDWDNMNPYIESAFKYAYTPDAMARIYRDLGYYYVELQKLDVAAALYIYSLKYEQTEQAYAELEYIKNLGQDIEITIEEAQQTLKDNNIQLVANPFIVEEFRKRGDKFAENEDLENALEMYTMAYILDDSMENQMRYKMAQAALNGEDHVNITL